MFFNKEQINKKEVIKWGLIGGAAELIYIVVIGLLMDYIGNNFGQTAMPSLGFTAFLMLFVFSAGVSGLFVFGYPAYLALQKRFQEAIMMALISLGIIFLGFFLAFLLLIIL
ncbi:MAG: hypothetical protein A2Y67_02615 [Candidatus Buchananbacteria bacterium RBG_13_39_9]|uniref:Major facilitator superfamily (MFS) profile domain-containing protein n=1 Tax=Candidatus Buchananbacteria bacterium RBG_13_39_9 TaxID=1797531 RepID=A0A1G1XSG6_9BACT|nr:MAG: hypothetical protein A2Y67_02615 [Candidatus Buchananbacteria bacterium RBG_13_39_9]